MQFQSGVSARPAGLVLPLILSCGARLHLKVKTPCLFFSYIHAVARVTYPDAIDSFVIVLLNTEAACYHHSHNRAPRAALSPSFVRPFQSPKASSSPRPSVVYLKNFLCQTIFRLFVRSFVHSFIHPSRMPSERDVTRKSYLPATWGLRRGCCGPRRVASSPSFGLVGLVES